MKLTLVRGLPGSGKSTYADKNKGDAFVVEADQFFMLKDDGYVYDKRFVHVAHTWCYAKVIQLLRHGEDVVVANTMTTVKELEKYTGLKVYFPDIEEITIIEMYTKYESIHNVSNESLEKMHRRWGEVPQEWISNGWVKVIRIGK